MLLLCADRIDARRRCIEHASEFRSSRRVVRENRKRRSVTSEALRLSRGSCAPADHRGGRVDGRIVASFFAAPGRVVRYFSAERTIWSIETPSSRV